MRLICPNCDAQYEVDAAVIPEGGRDVQCSSCGHTWFQTPATPALTALAEDEGPGTEEAAPRPPEPPKRRQLDDAVLSVLREEAERETRAREAEGTSLETQTDLGLIPPPPEPPAVPPPPPPPALTEAEAEDGPDTALVARASRRELLPDIEEINSTLRPTSERGNEPASRDAPESLRQRRSGFRRGFLTSVTAMILLLLPYVFADRLSQMVPAAAPTLTGYSKMIDGARLWLESSMRSTTESLKSSE